MGKGRRVEGEVEDKYKVNKVNRRGEEEVDNIIRKILEQQTHLRSHLDRLERTRRGEAGGGRKVEGKVEREVVVPEVVDHQVDEHARGQGGKEKGCSYLMKTFLNSTVESSEDFCRWNTFSVLCDSPDRSERNDDVLTAMIVESAAL